MRVLINQNKWFVLLFLSFAYFVLLYYGFGFYFQTNDDVGLLVKASGKGFVSAPSEYLLFVNVIIGFLLKSLYQLNSNVPWYTLFELGMLFVCFSYILYLFVFSKIDSLFVKVIATTFLLVSYSFFIVNLQYTMVASILTFTGYLVLFFDEKKACISRLVFVGFCFFLGALIRIHSFYLFQLFLFPSFLLYQYLGKSKLKSDYKIYICFFIVFVLVGVALAYDRDCYRNHESGVDWVVMNKYTGKYNNYFVELKESKQEVIKGRNEVGWTENDLVLLTRWAYFDTKIFSQTNLKAFDNALEFPQVIRWERSKQFFITLVKRNLISKYLILVSLMVLLLWKIGLKEGVTMVLIVVLSSFCFVYLASFLKPAPPRVYEPVVFGYFVLSTLFVFRTGKNLKGQRIKQILFFVFVCWFSFNLLRVQTNYSEYRHNAMVEYSQLLDYMKKLGKKYYFTSSGLPTQEIDVMSSDPFHGVSMISFGSSINSPTYIDQLKQYHITSIGEQLLKRDSIFVSLKGSKLRDWLANYFREHFDTDVEIVIESQFQKYDFIRFEPVLD